MGQVNRPGTLLDQITALRREIATVRRTSGIGGGAISDGSLTIQRGGSLRMVDVDGTELVYLGPGPDGRQIIRFRRQGGGDILATYTTVDGRPGWALSANSGDVMVADDPDAGDALARPWIPVPMTPVRPQDLPVVTGRDFETVVEARFTKTRTRMSNCPHSTPSSVALPARAGSSSPIRPAAPRSSTPGASSPNSPTSDEVRFPHLASRTPAWSRSRCSGAAPAAVGRSGRPRPDSCNAKPRTCRTSPVR